VTLNLYATDEHCQKVILIFAGLNYLLEMFFAMENFKLWLFVPKGRRIDAKAGKEDKGQQNYYLGCSECSCQLFLRDE